MDVSWSQGTTKIVGTLQTQLGKVPPGLLKSLPTQPFTETRIGKALYESRESKQGCLIRRG